MYEKGLLEVGNVYDSRQDESVQEGSVKWAYLPHSCEKWVVGGKDQVVQIILDLQNILNKIK